MSIASGLVVGGRRRFAPPYRKIEAPPRPVTGAKKVPSAAPVVARGLLWAALLMTACAFGPTTVALLMVAAAVIASAPAVMALPRPVPARSLVLAVGGPFAAAVSFIIAAVQSDNLALTLALVVCLYDAASYINSDGSRTGGRAGVVAGLATVAVLALFVGAIFVPPFTGVRPWLVLGITGLMAALGVRLASRVPGWERLPGMRRLDSLMLAGPVWVILVATVLQR